MITYIGSSIFESPAQVLVNTVNTEGVMGKGLALQFKKIFPEMFSEYQALCEQGKIDIGKLWIYKSPHKWVLNFPTKKLWRQPSRIEYIDFGLQKFVAEFGDLKIHSIAFPALGCGNGELNWAEVKPLMESHLRLIPADIFIHPPISNEEIPEHRSQKVVSKWLRSEPRTLAFSEVWRDLKHVLANKSEFRTSSKTFSARIIDTSERYLEIDTRSRSYRIEYDDLLEVWSRFRAHGYLRRGVVTNSIEKVLYYIIPVLAELDYVDRIELSETDTFSVSGTGKPLSGLQYTAPSQGGTQPSLFL
ncbi:MAG: macro domain-containing protein [Chloracidobacterium sp.]|nr:macro domain-containing protein [Chloracidobacterium sp.]